MSTFVIAPLTFTILPIMLFFFTAVLTSSLFFCPFHITVTSRDTAELAGAFSFLFFPVVRAFSITSGTESGKSIT